MDIAVSWWLSFIAGVITPLGAACVLPLYPGYIAHLSSRLTEASSRATILAIGLLVTSGILVSMLVVGYLFITIFQRSLSEAIQLISPVVFVVLAAIGIVLIAGIDLDKTMPSVHIPAARSPSAAAFLYGLFFGLLALPCNPGPIIVLFAISMNSAGFLENLASFLLFGMGMALPLIILTLVAAARSREVIGFLASHRMVISRLAGVMMLAVAVYYLGYLVGTW